MMKTFFLFLLTAFVQTSARTQNKLPEVLIRIDDIGMNHAVNTAIEEVAKSGIPFSTSIMFACPWYQEAASILKAYPNANIGVHLTLTAEWKHYRWGPVLGASAVPSLVDSLGYFLPTTQQFLKSGFQLAEVEKELTAQIERALKSGLRISYLDPHMGIALATPELKALTERLAKKYNLGISPLNEATYYGETYTDMWGVPVPDKKSRFLQFLMGVTPERPHMVVLHIAHATPEMNVLVDMNSNLMNSKEGKPQASQHRQTELNMLLSPEFKALVGKKFKLITYADLIQRGKMK